MLSSARVAKRISWFMVSNAADRSRRMRTIERDEVLAAWSDSVTVRTAVSVECAFLKPDYEGQVSCCVSDRRTVG